MVTIPCSGDKDIEKQNTHDSISLSARIQGGLSVCLNRASSIPQEMGRRGPRREVVGTVSKGTHSSAQLDKTSCRHHLCCISLLGHNTLGMFDMKRPRKSCSKYLGTWCCCPG